MHIIEATELHVLLEGLVARGYALVGPTVRSGAIVYDSIGSVDDLPRGWGDEQQPAHYRLKRREDGMYFSFAASPVSWKKFLSPPRATTFRAVRSGRGFTVEGGPPKPPPMRAFIGVRPCELNAIHVQDSVFTRGPFIDRSYKAARDGVFIVAVNCTSAGGNCFCASMGTGPGAKAGFDIALTERLESGRHFFTAEAGTPAGEEVLGSLHAPAASPEQEADVRAVVTRAAEAQTKRVETADLPQILKNNFEHARWDDVARRCLGCTNCTMVCPTCFCSTVEDSTDLTGLHAERTKRWDSCFTMDFTKVAGGNIRPSLRSRYRQWLTHKFSYWVDQFGTFGCVGCGRCITWCPSGIDITAEVDALRGNGVH